jgi:UDP-N-acetylmuramoylalanine--D-glutamate ligase
MRHEISFSDLAGRRVGVFGLGIEGRAARARLVAIGCEVIAVDDDPASTGDTTVLASREGGLGMLSSCDAVVKAPGISRYRDDIVQLQRAGVPVLGGVGMWLEEFDRSRVICVTGTKGKSTVATVIGHLASGLGTPAMVTGNLGVPPFEPGLDLDGQLVVVETSSFQATDVAHTPIVTAVTSLGEDHLDWHGTVERYRADKLSLTRQRGARHTIAASTEQLREHREQLGGEVTWTEGEPALATALGLAGRHGASNAAVAVGALRAAGVDGADDDDRLVAAAAGYEPLPGRFREIARHGGVRFIDDSLATNPLPTMAAIDAVGDARLALLLGGHDRGVDYNALVAAIAARAAVTLVVTLPDNGAQIGALVRSLRSRVGVLDASSVDEAVRLAIGWLGDDGIVLLSPAAPSFSQFTSWKERSDAFAAAVAAATR